MAGWIPHACFTIQRSPGKCNLDIVAQEFQGLTHILFDVYIFIEEI